MAGSIPVLSLQFDFPPVEVRTMSWLYISFVIYVVVLAVALGLFFLDVRLKDRRKQARQARLGDLDAGSQSERS